VNTPAVLLNNAGAGIEATVKLRHQRSLICHVCLHLHLQNPARALFRTNVLKIL
jgi:hypothetical protein